MAAAENVIPLRSKVGSPTDSDSAKEPFAAKSEWGDHGPHDS
jgi:hypothetical protein